MYGVCTSEKKVRIVHHTVRRNCPASKKFNIFWDTCQHIAWKFVAQKEKDSLLMIFAICHLKVDF